MTHSKILLVLLVVVGINYSNSLNNKFVWDDIHLIVENKFIKTAKNALTIINPKSFVQVIPDCPNVARPVWVLSAIFDYSIWGLNPFGHHLTNVLLHLLNCLLVYFFVYSTVKNLSVSLMAGLIFAAHPVLTESVAVVGFRSDLLVVFFCLSGFLLFIKSAKSESNRSKILYFIGANIFYVLGVLSKGMAISLPLLFILYDYFFISQSKFSKLLLRLPWYIPYLILIVGYLWFLGPRFIYEIPTDLPHELKHLAVYTSPFTNLFTMSKVFAHYVYLFFFPLNLCADYIYMFPVSYSLYDFSVIISLTVLVVLISMVFVLLKKFRIVSFSIMWFFVTLIPVSNIIPIVNLAAERYLYLPSIGFCMAAAAIFNKLFPKGYIKWTLLAVLITLYSVRTISRNKDWKDNFTLWTATIRTSQSCPRAHYNLGNIYREGQSYEQAIDSYKKAIQYYPLYSKAYNNIGLTCVDMGNPDTGLEYIKQAINIDPKNAEAYNNLGNIYFLKGEYNQALEMYKQTININPKIVSAYNNIGSIYFVRKDYENAIRNYNLVLKSDPNNLRALANLKRAHDSSK
ncbi:MAG: tetratricopeptide repeat protein [Elusimicrobia bacterium]|nr:tetratricopeptide repeat protein [Elusimicrobiota bacterium]